MQPKNASGGLRVWLLGQVRISRDDVELPLGKPQRRTVLARLALAEGQPVGRDELVDALWPADPPRSATSIIHTHIKHLRRVLEPDRPPRMASHLLPSAGTGYRLEVAPDAIDLVRFRRLVARARTAYGAGDRAGVWEFSGAALRLWQAPLADVPVLAEHPRIAAVTAEAQLVSSWRIETALQDGRAGEVLPLVRELAGAQPLNERAQAHLMRCYLALDRRAEAFAVFDATRRRLVGELGVGPAQVLTDAYRALLAAERPTAEAAQAVDPAPHPDRGVPAQLPPGLGAFTGRVEQVRWLDELVRGVPDAPRVAVISGTAGVGKTTLAVHWAHRVAGHFPDGQLYADLRGFDAGMGPVDPAEVIRAFLVALGVAPERIPVDRATQLGLYRSLLAGRRVLILLDNARRADQVRPLLPGSAGCVVVVTSRDELLGLVAAGALPLGLALPDAREARELLTGRIGAERVAAEPAAVDRLVAACARLPLALAIVAARACTHPRFPLAALSDQLRCAADPLTAFHGDDEAFDVRTVFSWSYRTLTPAAAALFRLLGLHPGPTVSAATAAALAGDVPVEQIRPLLSQLTGAHLVVEYRPGRYGFHDLLRAYAAELARTVDPEEARRDALQRVLNHYVRYAAAADRLIAPHRPHGPDVRVPPPDPQPDPGLPADTETASTWFATEHTALLGMVDVAAAYGLDRSICDLAWHMTPFLDRRANWTDQAFVQRGALAAADRLGDRAVQARTHRCLARAYLRLCRFDEARRELRAAAARYEALGDRAGLAHTEMSLADSCERRGCYADALAHAERALDLYDGVGDQPGTANALNAVGWCHALLGDHARALTYCTRALRLHQRLGDRRGAADTWDSIGYAKQGLARYRAAARCFERAVLLFRHLGDPFAEAVSLIRLGDNHRAGGDLTTGRASWSRALAILVELDHPQAEEVRTRLAG